MERTYTEQETKLAHFILDEMQWQYKNWGDNKDDKIEDRLAFVQKHLTAANEQLAAANTEAALAELRILSGIIFSILQKHPAPARPA
jgi:deoxyribodipyrimidine photolyase